MGFLFFPLLLNACDFSYWERLSARQFFLPKGKDYGRPEVSGCLTFGDLVDFNFRTGEIFPNPDRERFLMNALKKMEDALSEYLQKQALKQSIPVSPYFRILPLSELKPEDILETRSLYSQGYRDYYLHRPYLNDKLSYNYQHRKHTIITGKPLDGKSRSVLELCKQLKQEQTLLLLPGLKGFDMQQFRLPDTSSDLLVFFDDFERFINLENLDLALECDAARKLPGDSHLPQGQDARGEKHP